MNSSNHNTPQAPDNDHLSRDEGLSPVASSTSGMVKVVGVLVVAVLVLGLVFLPSSDDTEANVSLSTQQQEEEFTFGRSTRELPEPKEPASASAAPSVVHNNLDSARIEAELARLNAKLRALTNQQNVAAKNTAKDALADKLARRSASAVLFDGTGETANGAPNSLGGVTEAAGSGSDGLVEPVSADIISDTSAVILQGKMIPGFLNVAIQSDLSGGIVAGVSRDVYSYDATTLLIPKGSRLVGVYRSGLVTGQTRLFAIWERIITPEGVSINIKGPVTYAIGRAGVTGKVVTHFWKKFGSAMLISVVGAGLADQVDDNETEANDALASSFELQAEIALAQHISIPPTIHVAQGAPINVFVRQDLDFSNALKHYQKKAALTSSNNSDGIYYGTTN